MFAGVAFIVLVGLMVLFPFFLVTRLRLTKDQKFLYGGLAIAVPIVAFLIGKLVVASGLVGYKLSENTAVGELYAWIFVAPILFGSWAVFVVATIKQRSPETPNQKKQLNN